MFAFLFLQLHHAQVWIPFTGWLGRILISPAHHQIHHSTNPIHHNKNMGSCLAIFDWLFGTLHIPARQRERLTFGVTADAGEVRVDPHSLEGALLAPFRRGFGRGATQITGLARDAGQIARRAGPRLRRLALRRRRQAR